MTSAADQSEAPEIRLGLAPAIRVAAKALIIRDGNLLVTVNSGRTDDLFCLCPGGGQNHGEDAPAALRRECQEELGCDVVVGDFAFYRDLMGAEMMDRRMHQVEAYFFCELAPGAEPRITDTGDAWQTGFAWLPVATLQDEPVYPKALAQWLQAPAAERPGYLGDVD